MHTARYRTLLVISTLLALCASGCAHWSTDRVEPPLTSNADGLATLFEQAGKDPAVLRSLARTLIEKVGQPPEGAQPFWQTEVSRDDAAILIDYLSGVWSVGAVMVGGDSPRYIEIHIADRPVGIWIFETDIVEEFESHGPGHMSERYWDPAMVLVCDDRRYGQ